MSTDQPQATTDASTPDATQRSANAYFGGGDIVARAGRYYRNTRYVMFVLLAGMGGWFLYDGFVKYPRENQIVSDLKIQGEAARKAGNSEEQSRVATELKNHTEHTDTDIRWQKRLGFSLPPIAIALLAYSLYKSRGEYRLSGETLSVPGHPTVTLDDVKEVNDDLWDRKGILYLKYEKNGQAGEMMLDDFVYDRPPTDAIYDRIAAKFGLNEDEHDDAEAEDSPSAQSDSARQE